MKFPFFTLALSLAVLAPGFAAETASKKNAKDAKVPKAARVRYADEVASSVKPTKTIVYKRVGDKELKLHVFLPADWKATDRRPAFVTIHGGGWGGGDARRMYAFAADFAKRGMVGISVEYRLLKAGSGVTVFDCVQDGRSALRYVRGHAAELGIDPARIVANGGSAGGHVAVATAMFQQFDDPSENGGVLAEPNALVLFFPVIDTSKEGYGQAKIGDRWKELSPAHNVRKGLPPTLVFHGTGDTTTPFKGAQLFLAEMKKAGNRCELDVNEGGGHGYLMTTQALYDDTLAKTEKFLRDVGMMPKS
ncbi:MAG: alpha/beta hydrolase [Verrucomicrobiota bacterium]